MCMENPRRHGEDDELMFDWRLFLANTFIGIASNGNNSGAGIWLDMCQYSHYSMGFSFFFL